MKSASRWPWLIIALLAGFVALSAWSFYRAASGSSAVIDRDYYSHGLRYNQTLLEHRTASSLGWQVVSALEGRRLTAQLRDRDRQVVVGAIGTLKLHGSGILTARELALREVAAGSYAVDLPGGLQGEFSAEITFQRDGARLSQRLLFAIR